MKLIIEIDEEVYRAKQHLVVNPKRIRDEVDIAIANGTPYNPTGDCISREYIESVVRAEFVDLQDGTEEWRTCVNDTCENILTKVHNAPTVSLPMCNAKDEAICEEMTTDGHCSYAKHCPNKESTRPNEQIAWEQGYEAGLAQGKQDRPQGEYISVDTLFVKCSICGNLTRVLKKYNMPNFCPACGADMRKGGAE